MQVNLCNAQKKKEDLKEITISGRGVLDCIVTDSSIWLLSSNGILYLLNHSYSITKEFKLQSKIQAISIDSSKNILVAEANGTVSQIEQNLSVKLIGKTGQNIIDIIVTKGNSTLLITDKGIYIPEEERLIYQNAFDNLFLAEHSIYSWRPTCYYLDDENNLWMGFGAGEWGGDVLIYSISKKRLQNLKEKVNSFCYLSPVKSIFKVDSSVLIAQSVMHFNISSEIIKVRDSCSAFFRSTPFSDTSVGIYKGETIYIGPTIFNEPDNSLYLYSQFGVFVGNMSTDLSKMENWKLLFKANLKWRSGQSDAIGSPMNVKKLMIYDSKIFLVSPENGVLIWNGKNKILLR